MKSILVCAFFHAGSLAFTHQTLKLRSTSLIVAPFKKDGKIEVEKTDNRLLGTDEFPTDDMLDPWKGRTMIESDGNYLDTTWLEIGALYANQGDLKSLPVPKLTDTVNRFMPSALPLAETEEEIAELEEACAEFESQASRE